MRLRSHLTLRLIRTVLAAACLTAFAGAACAEAPRKEGAPVPMLW